MQSVHQAKKLFIVLFSLLVYGEVKGITSCDNPLGLESRIVPDSKITASTTKSDAFLPWDARLNGGSSWCAENNDTLSPWIQVSFDEKHRFTELMIQGSRQQLSWVKKYRIEYRLHGMKWRKYPKHLNGNNMTDYKYGKKTVFHSAFVAQDVRVYPLEVDGISTGSAKTFSLCLRMELYGCRHYANCALPGVSPNSTLESIDITHNGQARFRCHRGFTMIGPQIITCDKGRWDQPVPLCKAQCPDPGTPSNGQRIGSTFLESNVVRFTCNKTGFDLIGSSVVRCHKGQWSAATPTCKARCPRPGVPTNGALTKLNIRHGGVSRFRCRKGFKLQGSSKIVCNNGKWDHPRPYCVVDDDDDGVSGSGSAASCSDPGVPVNGGRRAASFREGRTVRFFCQPGFVLFGSKNITCRNGQWTGWTPQCRKTCKNPGAPINGGRHGNNFAEGQYVRFFCQDGYVLIGQDNAMCIDGQWSSQRPICRRPASKCTMPNVPQNMQIYGAQKQFYDKGDKVLYVCSPGYFSYGFRIRTCQGTRWTKIKFRCIPKSCGDPDAPRNGYKTGLVYSVHRTVSYYCYQGYELRGSSVIRCLVNGTWSNTKPECRAVDCGYLPTPSNGVIEITKTSYNGIATFKCTKRGYSLVGPKTRRCQSNGRWTGSQPRCLPRSCGRPSSPAHGSTFAQSGYFYKSTITFTCDKGYAMQGSARSVCLDDGTWSSPVPICKRVPKRCPVNWIKYNGNCYFFKHRTRRTQPWRRLRSRCKKLKADLVDLYDNQEWDFIKRHLKTSVSVYAIGLRKSKSGSWRWTTGRPVPMWVSSSIDTASTCGVVKGWSGEFTAVPCNNRKVVRAYICKK